MDDAHEPVAHLGLPLAVAAAGGAAVVSSMTRWWLCGPFNGVVAMAVAAAIGALIGSILTNSVRCDTPRVTARKAFAFLALGAPICSLLVMLVCDETQRGGDVVLLGLAFAMALLPGASLALRVARAAQRSRLRSLVGSSDRRAAWRATAVWLGAAALVGGLPSWVDAHDRTYLASLFWWDAADKAKLAVAPLAVALAAFFTAASVALLDWRAEHLVRRARVASSGWRVDVASPATTTMDIGVGDDAWMEHVSGRSTYREQEQERVAALGDLARGERLLHKATRRSAIALTIVGAAVLASLYVYALLTRAR